MAEEISLSIEETNKLRKELGLKPLDTKQKDVKLGSSDRPYDRSDDVSRIGHTAKEVEIMEAEKQRRKDYLKIASGKGLGDILGDDDGEDAATWAARHAITSEQAQKEAEKMKRHREKLERRHKRQNDKEAEEEMLARFKVAHKMDSFKEGEEITLTLADETILNKDGTFNKNMDRLEDYRRVQNFKDARREAMLKKTREATDPTRGFYQADSLMGISEKTMLDKYDEVPDKEEGFSLKAAIETETKLDAIMNQEDDEDRIIFGGKKKPTRPQVNLKSGSGDNSAAAQSLNAMQSGLRFQDDYMDEREVAVFRKKQAKAAKRRKIQEDESFINKRGKGFKTLQVGDDIGSDEEDPELYHKLQEALKKQQLATAADRDKKKGEEKLKEVVKNIKPEGDDAKARERKEKSGSAKTKPGEKKKFVTNDGDEIFPGGEEITDTSIFTQTVKSSEDKEKIQKSEQFDGMQAFITGRDRAAKLQVGGQAMVDDEDRDWEAEMAAVQDTLAEKPIDNSIASAMQFLRQRNDLGKDQNNFFTGQGDDRVHEASTIDGDVKLDYRDEYGRLTTPKEMFRQLSWRFHGQAPCARNQEKRKKRLQQENTFQAMDINRPKSQQALEAMQKQTQKAHMELGP